MKLIIFIVKNRYALILFFKCLQVQITIMGQLSKVNGPVVKSKCYLNLF